MLGDFLIAVAQYANQVTVLGLLGFLYYIDLVECLAYLFLTVVIKLIVV